MVHLEEKHGPLEVRYGLTWKVNFCKVCCTTNQRPCSVNDYAHTRAYKKHKIATKEEGICAACINEERPHSVIKWLQWEWDLREICDLHCKDDQSYNCSVPGSGGKYIIYASWLSSKVQDVFVDGQVGAASIHRGELEEPPRLVATGKFLYLSRHSHRSHPLLGHAAAVQNLSHPFQP